MDEVGVLVPYPARAADRDRWILARRGDREAVDPERVVTAFVEDERSETGAVVPIATLFLANRECPFRCLMCDLWRHTLAVSVEPGAIPRQIERTLGALPPARQIKLYNSGSFFDPRAIPPADYPAIARLCQPFERVIVECHPAFVGEACLKFRDQLDRDLEIAIGLETAHPGVLEKLNKRMTTESFRRATGFLTVHEIAVRVFLLLRPPFLSEAEGIEWAVRSMTFAFNCGATVCSLIPTRGGNGALEALGTQFESPRLTSLEAVAAAGVAMGRGRVFADLWDLERFSSCASCFSSRFERLRTMNLEQKVPTTIDCAECRGGSDVE